MEKRKKYDFELLQKYCSENNVVLLEDYSNQNIVCHFVIEGKCSNKDCSNNFKKNLYKLINTNAMCNPCIFIQAKVVRKETNLKTIGKENYFQCEIIKNKIKDTNIKKYGVEYISQSEIIRNKVKETCLKKYGFHHQSYNKTIQEKITQTNILKYGVEHLMKNPEYLENMLKNAFKFKNYTLPSGKIITYQGYENLALDELIINEKMNESDIIIGVKNVPEIWFFDKNNKEHRYYVDIFIPSQNKCIEVKSLYTYEKDKYKNLLKEEAAQNLGYNFEFWIYDKKGNKITA
jgi:hypothetical protein